MVHKLKLETRATETEQFQEMARVEKSFWYNFKQFSNKLGIYSPKHIWMSEDIEECPDLWHEMYSDKQAQVFGEVASRVCSKSLGIGEAERKWGDVKHLKTDKRSGMGACSMEMQATLCGHHCVERAKAKKKKKKKKDEKLNTAWGEDDFKSLGFNKYLIDLGSITGAKKAASKFLAFVEPWEVEAATTKNTVP